MTIEENNRIKAVTKERIMKLHPENCCFCGGFHDIRLSKDGTSIVVVNNCCHDILREANKIIRETRKEYNDTNFLQYYGIE